VTRLAFPALLLGFVLLACTSEREGDDLRDVTLGQEFVLAPGETVAIEGSSDKLSFDGVDGDSRCPTDVVCVWSGEAELALTATIDGVLEAVALKFGAGRDEEAAAGPYLLRALGVEPAPVSTSPIEPADYRATLRVDLR
jgi:hypothetical protein